MKTASVELLGERRLLAYKLRKEGRSFRQIGDQLLVSAGRANQLYRSAEMILSQKPHWSHGLSVRPVNCLSNCNINSRAEALEAYQSGRLRPGKYPRNYGLKSHKELAAWLGVPYQKPIPRVYVVKVCPHCGRKLSGKP